MVTTTLFSYHMKTLLEYCKDLQLEYCIRVATTIFSCHMKRVLQKPSIKILYQSCNHHLLCSLWTLIMCCKDFRLECFIIVTTTLFCCHLKTLLEYCKDLQLEPKFVLTSKKNKEFQKISNFSDYFKNYPNRQIFLPILDLLSAIILNGPALHKTTIFFCRQAERQKYFAILR